MNTADALTHALDLERVGRADEAESIYRDVLAKQPGNADALHLLGILIHRRGRTAQAIELLEKASRRAPRNVQILNNLGQILKAAGRLEDAETRFRRAIAFRPDFADAHNNLGTTLAARKRTEEAEACFRRALQADSEHGPVAYNLATILTTEGRFAEAIPLFRRIVAARPNSADAHNNLGYALLETGAEREAEFHFRTALGLVPDHADALANLAGISLGRTDLAAAEDSLNRALAVNPRHARALSTLGIVMLRTSRDAEAIDLQRRAMAIDPSFDEASVNLAVLLMSACAWNEYDRLIADLDVRTRAAIAAERRPPESPFLAICRSADPAFNFQVARLRSADMARQLAPMRLPSVSPLARAGRQRIVLGYLSADFRNHPVGHLIRPLFSLHDRRLFEVRAYSAGPDDGSDYRKEFEREADAFADIRMSTDHEAAERIRADGVDILVDLGGYTHDSRLGVAALRPAPIAVLHAGFPGTTGSDFIDYLIADRIVVPPEDTRHYSEKMIVVPDCHAPQEPPPAASGVFSRQNEGLPDGAFVFCSFNESRKLTSSVYGAWMRLLNSIPRSVLWLIRGNDLMAENLSRAAAAQGIDPARLIFAARRPRADHLARLSLADLALDTMPFNGAVTTGDALWAGVPVVTVRGSHFASRYSESKMAAAGLPSTMAAASLDEYESLARRLAQTPAELAALRACLAQARPTAPLFDMPAAVRVLERGYAEAFRLFLADQPPRHIVLDEAARGLYGKDD